jgi:hypothetical protein
MAKKGIIKKGKGIKNPQETLTYRAAKRMAVSLGMPFPDACSGDWGTLMTYISNSKERPNPELITKYDEWMDKQLESRGYGPNDPMRHYQLRLSYISEDATTKAPKIGLKTKKEKILKPKREKDEVGLWKGTKKSYTFELSYRGYPLERVVKRVLRKFPDANENSIKQWWKKAQKQQKEKNETPQ